jgi:hypothetical protein
MRPVQVDDTIAVSEVSMNSNMRCIPNLVFAKVLAINKAENFLSVSFTAGYQDDCFTNEEFVIIKSELHTKVALASELIVSDFKLLASSFEKMVIGVIST